MGAAVGGRQSVAIGRQKAIGIGGPRYRPFAGAVGAIAAGFSSEDIRMHQGVGMDRGGEIILQSPRKVKAVLGGYILDALEQCGIAAPADFDAAEQIGLGASHLEQPLRLERSLGAENLGVRFEADLGAAAAVDLARLLEAALAIAALERPTVELFAAGVLELEPRG